MSDRYPHDICERLSVLNYFQPQQMAFVYWQTLTQPIENLDKYFKIAALPKIKDVDLDTYRDTLGHVTFRGYGFYSNTFRDFLCMEIAVNIKNILAAHGIIEHEKFDPNKKYTMFSVEQVFPIQFEMLKTEKPVIAISPSLEISFNNFKYTIHVQRLIDLAIFDCILEEWSVILKEQKALCKN